MTHEHEAGIEVPGLPGYRFVALPLEQRDAPVVSEGRYHHSGRFSVAGVPPPMKLLVRFESQPGPLSFGLTGLDADAYQLGEVGVRLLWLAVQQPVPDELSFACSSTMRTRVAQVLLVEDASGALPWPPPKPSAEAWRREQANFETRGPTSDQDGWRVRLRIGFEDRKLPAEFLVTYSGPFSGLDVVEAEDSPRGAGCLIEAGPRADTFIVIVQPTSLVGFDHVVLWVKGASPFRVQSVERLWRP